MNEVRAARSNRLLASAAVHAFVIGSAIVYCGFATHSRAQPVTITLALANERAAPPPAREHRAEVPVTEELHEDDPLTVTEPVVPPRPPVTDRRTPLDPGPPPTNAAPTHEDWLAVIRRPKPVVDTEPPAPSPRPTTSERCEPLVLPTPIEGQNRKPGYPARALRLGISGTVVIRVHVDAHGVVTSCAIESSSGSRLLDTAALAAIARWRFQDGPGTTTVPIIFQIVQPRS